MMTEITSDVRMRWKAAEDVDLSDRILSIKADLFHCTNPAIQVAAVHSPLSTGTQLPNNLDILHLKRRFASRNLSQSLNFVPFDIKETLGTYIGVILGLFQLLPQLFDVFSKRVYLKLL